MQWKKDLLWFFILESNKVTKRSVSKSIVCCNFLHRSLAAKVNKKPRTKNFFSSFAIQKITHIFIHASIIIKYVFSYTTIVFNVNSQKIFKNLRILPARCSASALLLHNCSYTPCAGIIFLWAPPWDFTTTFPKFFFLENELSSAFPKKFYSMIKKLKTKKGTIFSRQKFWTLVCPTTWCWHVVRLLMRFTDWDHWQPKFSLLWM